MSANGTAASSSAVLASHMQAVAGLLLGEPNRQLSNGHELRYGNHGSLSVDLEAGTWFDHENEQGGGVLDLVQRQRRCGRREALHWLQHEAGLRLEPEPVKAPGKARARVVARYIYHDAEGRPIHRTLRWEPKRFSQQRFEDGEWVGGKGALNGVQRVLYHLPEVLAAGEVVITEGEKDADRLRSLGFAATTCAEGAGKWQPSFAEALASKHITITPDNDPVGRKHAETIAASLHGKAASVKVVQLEGLPAKGDVSDWLDAGGTADELHALIAKASEWKKAEDKQPEASVRTDIRLTPQHWNKMLGECAGVLQTVLYMRGTVPVMLARVVEADGKKAEDQDGAAVDLNGVRYRPGSLLFMEAVPGRVAWYLDEHATFWRYVRREDEWVAQHCPKEVAASLVDAAIYLDFRPCAGVVHVPLLAGRGLVTRSGYHAPTALILDLRGKPFTIPKAPDRKAAKRALVRLLKPFRGYLSVGGTSRAAIAAAALTAVLRPSLPTAPAILIDGNNPAVGKGKLARTLGAIATGTLPAVITEGHSDEETEKRIASAVLQGAPVILLDNLQRQVASSTLESMLTEPVADIRAFGRLANLRVLCRALVLLTANNASLRRDMLRRTLSVRIVVADENPELRHFDFDPVEEATNDRYELVVAAITIALAWLRKRDLKEHKEHRKALGSFEEWADLVAGAVSWLTGENPVDLIEQRKDQDAGSTDERRVVAALEAQFGEQEWTAKQAAEMVPTDVWAGAIRFKGEKPTGVDVGNWLRKLKDRVFAVKREDGASITVTLASARDRKGFSAWSLPRVLGVAEGNPHSRAKNGISGADAKSGEAIEKRLGNPQHPRHSLNGNDHRDPMACRYCGTPCSPSDMTSFRDADDRWRHLDCEPADDAEPRS